MRKLLWRLFGFWCGGCDEYYPPFTPHWRVYTTAGLEPYCLDCCNQD